MPDRFACFSLCSKHLPSFVIKLALLQVVCLAHFCEQESKEAAFPFQIVFSSDRKEFFRILKKAPSGSALIDAVKNNMNTTLPCGFWKKSDEQQLSKRINDKCTFFSDKFSSCTLKNCCDIFKI